MAYVAPTIADLKARFPGLTAAGDPLLTLVLNEAIAMVGPAWRERDRATAQLYYAAHLLASQGLADGSNGASAVTGPVKRDRVGDAETEFAGLSGSGGAADASDLGSTIYGQQYRRLLRLNFPGVAVA